MAKMGISFIILVVGAYALGQTELPWTALTASVDWLSAHGYIAVEESIAGQMLTRL